MRCLMLVQLSTCPKRFGTLLHFTSAGMGVSGDARNEDLNSQTLSTPIQSMKAQEKSYRQNFGNITSFEKSGGSSESHTSRKWGTRQDVINRLNKSKAMAHESMKNHHQGTITTKKSKDQPIKPNKKIAWLEINQCVGILEHQKERVGIFKKATKHPMAKTENSISTKSSLDWWDQLTKRNLAGSYVQAPINHYEEMLRWSEGSFPLTFPINNEDNLEEKDIPFYKHAFLDHLLDDKLPKVGSVQKYMEAVIAGLSENSYLTIKEKEEHIRWFTEYFCEKAKTMHALDDNEN